MTTNPMENLQVDLMENERLDDLQRNGLKIIQKTDGFVLVWMRYCFPDLRR